MSRGVIVVDDHSSPEADVSIDALQRTVERYRTIAGLTSDAAYELDARAVPQAETESSNGGGAGTSLVLSWHTDALSTLLGDEHDALPDDGDWTDRVHPDDRVFFRRHRDRLRSGVQAATEYRVQTSTGGTRWVCDRAKPVRDEAGRVQCIRGTLRDVSERKASELALRTSAKTYKLTFTHSPLGVFHFDASGRLTDCNENFVRIIGSSHRTLVGMDLLEDLEDPVMIASIRKTLEDGRARYEGEYASVTADKVTPVRVLLNAIHDDDGTVLGGVGLVEDVTERKRYERQLVAAKEEAEKMNRLKSAFLANMSHEIRTPLTAIIGFASLLEEEMPSSHRRLPRLIAQSGERLMETLNSVLDLSMLESGQLELQHEVLDVAAQAREQVKLMRSLAANNELDLRFVPPEQSAYARLAPSGFDRILSNLIGNAIKFTNEGSVTVRVAVDDDTVRVHVDDTGVGISDAFMPHLFEAFKQESAGLRRSYEGTGLGLSITKRLVTLLGGTITAESTKGRGSRFTVTFPRANERPGTTPNSGDHAVPQATGAHVLLVEDSPETVMLVRRLLERHHTVDDASDATMALEMARSGPYDAVLMDIHLDGDRSGVDALRALRELPAYADVPVIAMTAYAMTGDRDRFLDAGFDAYLSKPFTRDQLLSVLDRTLE